MKTDEAIEKIKSSRDYLDPENQRDIDQLEKTFEKLKTDRAFLELDYIRDIKNRIKSVILNIKLKLAEEDEPEKRRVLKADREAYIWLLKFFSRDVDKELADVNRRANELL